ncbi:MAG TPA: SDR family oxidoreductase [Woeseiaceae bacterium]|nr:SDR family oxidoreductase [Woeseiaceae bacterium]
MMDRMLDGQVAIVTGGSGGIGRAICRCLAGYGAKVIVHYRAAQDAALELVEALEGEGRQARAIGADLSTAKGCESLVAASREAFGTATILVNNAALQPVAAFERISAADLASMLATNVQGPFRLMQLFAEGVIEAGIRDASIVNIASIEGSRPAIGHSHYATSKSALIMATRAAALELGRHNIRVNSVSPGLVDRDGLEEEWPEGVGRWRRSAPLGRLGAPDDVANAVAYLASPLAGWITGHDLVIDGGASISPAFGTE